MRYLLVFMACGVFCLASCTAKEEVSSAPEAPATPVSAPVTPADSIAGEHEIGCGMCIYGMDGVRQCKLAVKVDGKAYLLKGFYS